MAEIWRQLHPFTYYLDEVVPPWSGESVWAPGSPPSIQHPTLTSVFSPPILSPGQNPPYFSRSCLHMVTWSLPLLWPHGCFIFLIFFFTPLPPLPTYRVGWVGNQLQRPWALLYCSLYFSLWPPLNCWCGPYVLAPELLRMP